MKKENNYYCDGMMVPKIKNKTTIMHMKNCTGDQVVNCFWKTIENSI